MEKWKFYLMIAAPNLDAVSRMLAAKDANTTGSDDVAAAFLHYTSLAINAILQDQPVPEMPKSLASALNQS